MNEAAPDTALLPAVADHPAAASTRDGWYRRRLFTLLGALRGCELTVDEDGRRLRFGEADPAGGELLRVELQVRDPELYRLVALRGSVGVGEAYVDGLWDCSDLTTLVRVFVRNRALLDRMEGGLARLGALLLKGFHALRRNHRRGSRRNIAAHYDLGNELFRTFLDDNLMYSSAVFADRDESLERASRRKVERICAKLELGPGERVLEIGSGWGGFALHAAAHYGCHVTTTTISGEQYQLARSRIAAAGLGDRITLLQRDYRELEGRYDKLVSIEMVEAIGARYLDGYFARCASLLEPHGMALIQAITIEDYRYAQALRNVDFIQRYVFPGSFMPSVGALCAAVARTDLKLFHLEDIGPSYALTLRHWRQRFNAALDRVRALGYPDRFVRLWNYYLAYCEGGFLERSVGDVQMLMVKPFCRRGQYLPDLA